MQIQIANEQLLIQQKKPLNNLYEHYAITIKWLNNNVIHGNTSGRFHCCQLKQTNKQKDLT